MKKYILSLLTCILLIPAFTTCNMLDEVNYGSPTTEDMLANERKEWSLNSLRTRTNSKKS